MFLSLLLFTASILLHSPSFFVTAFNPLEYHVSVATCPAVDRSLNQTMDITVGGYTSLYAPQGVVSYGVAYFDINPSAKTTILMVHGWPSLWSSWGHQIEHLKSDYHLIAIDVRGFGGSSHPSDVQSSSTLADVTGDLTCVLEHARVSSAICMGHDWGSITCYEAARRRPDMFSGVVGVTTPYPPSSSQFQTIESIAALIPTLSYQIFFARNTSKAVIELNEDVRRSLRGTLRNVASPPPKSFLRSRETFMGAWNGVEIPPIPFFSKEEEDYFIQRFSRQGFDRSLFFYTIDNKYGTWKSAHDQGNFTIPQPVLSVLPLQDPVADWVMVAEFLNTTAYLPQLTLKTMDGAHWPHMEFPDVFNAIVDEWLAGVGFKVDESSGAQLRVKSTKAKHSLTDEL